MGSSEAIRTHLAELAAEEAEARGDYGPEAPTVPCRNCEEPTGAEEVYCADCAARGAALYREYDRLVQDADDEIDYARKSAMIQGRIRFIEYANDQIKDFEKEWLT